MIELSHRPKWSFNRRVSKSFPMPMAKGLIEFKFMRDSTITKEKGEGGEIWRRKIVALSGSSLSPRMTKDVTNERRLTYKEETNVLLYL